MEYTYDNNGNMLSQMQNINKDDTGSIEAVGLSLLGVDSISKDAIYEYDRIILETDSAGKETARNIYGTNLISRTADSQTLHYLYNGHADVTALVSSSIVVASYYYDAFGVLIEEIGSADNPYRYAGYEYDIKVELYNLKARFYNAGLARFLQEDTYRGTADDPLSLNLYSYCNNDPIRYYDPTGHAAVDYEQLAEELGISTDPSSPYADIIDCILGNGGGFGSVSNVPLEGGGTLNICSGGSSSGGGSSGGSSLGSNSGGSATIIAGNSDTDIKNNSSLVDLLLISGKYVSAVAGASTENDSDYKKTTVIIPSIMCYKSTNKVGCENRSRPLYIYKKTGYY